MNGLRMTVNFSMRVGSGTGPVTVEPVRCAVSTICAADWSMSLWSYAFRRIRMRCFAMTTGPRPFSCEHLRHDARADGVAAFADGEAQALFEGDGRAQGHLEGDVVPGDDHLAALGELGLAGDVGGAHVELGPVAREEGGVPAALLLGEDVDLGVELGVRLDAGGLGHDLTALDVVALQAAQQEADVVPGL